MKCLFVLFIPILLCQCSLLTTNKYLMHYKEVSDISSIENKLEHEKRFYPTALEMESSNACVEEYVRLKPDGYILIGYSLFHHEGKMSQGLLIQSGVKLGAHKIIFSRERSYSGSLSPQTHDSEEKFEGRPILESLAYKPSKQYETSSNNYVHHALFLVQQSLEK